MEVFVLINAASGSCSESDESELTRRIEACGHKVIGTWCGSGEGLHEAYSALEAASPELVVVLGGDGTIRSVIENCRKEGRAFILLPGGTMNMLVRAIYGEKTWQEIISETLVHPQRKTISSGTVGGKEFYVAAIFGTPSLLAHTREAIRSGDVGAAVTHGVSVLATPFMRFAYESPTLVGSAETLLITTPLVSTELHNEAKALDVAAVVIPGAFETLRLLSAAALGIWRKDENVATHAARRITISAPEPIPATLDGEPTELPCEVVVEFKQDAFTVVTASS